MISFHGRQQTLVQPLAQHQSMGEVVDVLGGAGEMDELCDRLQLGQRVGNRGDLFLDEIFHGLDVVVGGALDRLDLFGIRQAKSR